ncbi:hypothetical protein KEM55_008478 [Ascosphaera atra]|nr:hypothetical protein KEM55_008478 [Ascosphaera atra]
MELLALLTYLTSRRDVEKAMEVYSSAEHRLRQEAAVLKTELDTFLEEKGLKHAIITAGAKGLPGEPTRDDPRRGWEEMRKVWNTFDEKELRVHIDLEEWLEEAGLSGDKPDERGRDSLPIQMPHDESSENEI